MRSFVLALVLSLAGWSGAPADQHRGLVTDLLVTDQGVFSVSQGGIFVGAGESLALVAKPEMRVMDLAFRSEKNALLIAGGMPGERGVLQSIPARQGAAVLPQTSKELSSDLLYAVAISPQGMQIAVGGAEGRVWAAEVNEVLGEAAWSPRHEHTAAVRAVAFSPDGKWLASVGLDGVLMLSEIGSEASPRKMLDHTAGIESLCFSPDSKFIASGSIDSRVRMHATKDGSLVRTYTRLGMENEPVAGRVVARVLSLAWGEQLVAGTSKGTLHQLSLVDATSKRFPQRQRGPISALAFKPNGELVIGTTDRVDVVRLTAP